MRGGKEWNFQNLKFFALTVDPAVLGCLIHCIPRLVWLKLTWLPFPLCFFAFCRKLFFFTESSNPWSFLALFLRRFFFFLIFCCLIKSHWGSLGHHLTSTDLDILMLIPFTSSISERDICMFLNRPLFETWPAKNSLAVFCQLHFSLQQPAAAANLHWYTELWLSFEKTKRW